MKTLFLITFICLLVSPAMADENVCGPGQDGYLVWINCPASSLSLPDGAIDAPTSDGEYAIEIPEYLHDLQEIIREIVREELQKDRISEKIGNIKLNEWAEDIEE